MIGAGHEERLRAIVREVAGRPEAEVALDDDLALALGLDSLTLLRIVAAAERAFGARVPDARLASIRTLRALLAELDS